MLACALTMLPVTPASAATARATTMKLEKTEGTVSLKTQNGSARKITNGMRLYNGNTLATGKYSYAYVSLDSSKAVKLDQSSTATLRQSGKELELLVKDGKLFFNVSKPLTDKESMNVRTSTMVTGIRGTCGVVESVSAQTSKLYLLEGTVTLGSGENATTIQGGQTATVVLPPKQEAGGSDKPGTIEKPSIQVEKMTEETIPPVALQEIVNNKTLQEKIEKTTELKVEKIEKAFEQFQKEEAERIEQEKKEQEKDKEDKNKEDKEDKKEEDKKEDQKTDNDSQSGSSSSDSGSSYVPSTPVTPDPPTTPDTPKEPTKTVLSGTAITFEQLSKALLGYDDVTLEGVVKLGANDQLLIPAAKTLVVNGGIEGEGEISLGAGSILSNNGTIMAATIADVQTGQTGSVKNSGKMELSGAYSSRAPYTQTDEAILICVGPAGGEAPLFIVCDVQKSTVSGSEEVTNVKSVIAKGFNQKVADYLYERSDETRVSASLQRDLIVDSAVTMKGARKENLQVALVNQSTIRVVSNGTLTLENVWMFHPKEFGEDDMISLEGGHLRITGKYYTEIHNFSSGYAVKVSTGSTITIDNPKFQIYAEDGVGSIIEGLQYDSENNRLLVPHCVTASAGTLVLSEDQKRLSYDQNIQQTFLSGVVTQAAIEAAFQSYDWVHINSNAQLQLEENTILVIPSGKMLELSGNQYIPKTITIQVGDADGSATLSNGCSYLTAQRISLMADSCLNNYGSLYCEELTAAEYAVVSNSDNLKVTRTLALANRATFNNWGQMYGADIKSDGGAQIRNAGLIWLSGSYTSAGKDTYSKENNENAVFVSGLESPAIADELLMTARNSTGAALRYIYAGSMVKNVVENLNLNSTDLITWKFAKNAVIPANDAVTLSYFRAEMGQNELQVLGSLTLNGECNIVGSGEATVRLTTGGELSLGTPSEEAMTATIKNENEGFAIAGEGGTIAWNNKRFRLVASGGFEKTLTGVAYKTDSNLVQAPGYVTLAEGCSLEWNPNQNELRYVPSEFLNPAETVGAGNLNYVLQYNPIVTVGAIVSGVLNAGETVTIPSGKTLVIQSQLSQIDTDQYSGGFSMASGSAIELEQGAKLIVDGTIIGNGSIRIATDSSVTTGSSMVTAQLLVKEGGCMMADTIALGTGGLLVNDGTIDIGAMTSTGGAFVSNQALIKIKGAYTCSSPAAIDSYKCTDNAALISDKESTAINDLLFAYGYTQNTDGTARTILQYYYASSQNELVTKYMDLLKEAHSDIQWEIKQDTSASAGI